MYFNLKLTQLQYELQAQYERMITSYYSSRI